MERWSNGLLHDHFPLQTGGKPTSISSGSVDSCRHECRLSLGRGEAMDWTTLSKATSTALSECPCQNVAVSCITCPLPIHADTVFKRDDSWKLVNPKSLQHALMTPINNVLHKFRYP